MADQDANNANPASTVNAARYDLVVKPADPNARWEMRNYDFELVDGHFVPVHHAELYRQIVRKYGHLYPDPVNDDNTIPKALLALVIVILDLIQEMNNMQEAGLTRGALNGFLGKITCAAHHGLSVGWLLDKLQELGHVVDNYEGLANARQAKIDSELNRELVLKEKADAELAEEKVVQPR